VGPVYGRKSALMHTSLTMILFSSSMAWIQQITQVLQPVIRANLEFWSSRNVTTA